MTEEDAKIFHHRQRTEFLNKLRHKQTRQGRFDAHLLHFDHPLPGGGHVLEPSDGGADASRIRANCEVIPLWLTLWRNGRKTLKPKHRAILDALLEDMRPHVAARRAHVSKNLVYECLERVFPRHFAAAYRNYRKTGQTYFTVIA